MGLPPSIGPRPSRSTGVSIRNRVPILGRCFRFSYFQNFAALSLRARSPDWTRYQASAVGVGSGSDCGGASRERARLCFVLVGFGAASTTSGFDPEAGV
jgi:hypothetical protein